MWLKGITYNILTISKFNALHRLYCNEPDIGNVLPIPAKFGMIVENEYDNKENREGVNHRVYFERTMLAFAWHDWEKTLENLQFEVNALPIELIRGPRWLSW